MNKRAFYQLRRMVRSWGGDIILLEGAAFPERVAEAPFAWGVFGVDWYNKKIYARSGCFKRPMGFIHEAGHIFAVNSIPTFAEEFDFMGWEYLMARELDVLTEWYVSMATYCIYPNHIITKPSKFGELSPDEATDTLEEMVERGRKYGNIVGEQPVSVR